MEPGWRSCNIQNAGCLEDFLNSFAYSLVAGAEHEYRIFPGRTSNFGDKRISRPIWQDHHIYIFHRTPDIITGEFRLDNQAMWEANRRFNQAPDDCRGVAVKYVESAA